MLELSQLNLTSIEILSDIYDFIDGYTDSEPANLSVFKQRKLRKIISESYAGEISMLPDELKEKLLNTDSTELTSFLKSCNEYIEKYGSAKDREFEKNSFQMNDEVKSAIHCLLDSDSFPEIVRSGSDIEIIIDDDYFMSRTLTLKDSDFIPDEDYEDCYFSNQSLTYNSSSNRYVICGDVEMFVDDEVHQIAISFSDAEVKTEYYCFNALSDETFDYKDNPWEYLIRLAEKILTKSMLSKDMCNSKEYDLLPLLAEITSLGVNLNSINNPARFTVLKQLAEKYRCNRIVKLLSYLETKTIYSSPYNRIVSKVKALLCQSRYSPIWREIFELIKASQQQYPDRAQMLCPAEFLHQTRIDIDRQMHEYGYEGEYPDYHKHGKISGIHLESSYNLSYFIGMEKDVDFFIHCIESFDKQSEYLEVQFLCGTSLNKNGDSAKDIYDCLFNHNGRRLFYSVFYDVNTSEECEDNSLASKDIIDSVSNNVRIAVKKTELIKLTKDERKAYHGKMATNNNFDLLTIIIAGILFGLFMTAGFILIEFIILIFTGLPSLFSELFSSTPWWLIFLLSGSLFAGALAIIQAIINRK